MEIQSKTKMQCDIKIQTINTKDTNYNRSLIFKLTYWRKHYQQDDCALHPGPDQWVEFSHLSLLLQNPNGKSSKSEVFFFSEDKISVFVLSLVTSLVVSIVTTRGELRRHCFRIVSSFPASRKVWKQIARRDYSNVFLGTICLSRWSSQQWAVR